MLGHDKPKYEKNKTKKNLDLVTWPHGSFNKMITENK